MAWRSAASGDPDVSVLTLRSRLRVAASVTHTVQMKVDQLNTFKNQPLSDTVVKNDVALVVSLVYEFE
jgi:hypothetical protein